MHPVLKTGVKAAPVKARAQLATPQMQHKSWIAMLVRNAR